MTRVSQRSVSVFTGRSPNWVAKRKARKHKVILESVTQEKKKLRSVVCHHVAGFLSAILTTMADILRS